MAQVLEAMMLVCFGLSWPANIMKSYRSRTAKGKSILFEILIITGYIFGLAGKFVGDNVTYVVGFYFMVLLLVSVDLVLTLRNRVLDRMADKKAEKEEQKA